MALNRDSVVNNDGAVYFKTSTIGTTAENLRSVSFYNSGAADALIDGVTLSVGVSVTFDARDRLLRPIDYDATGTELTIAAIED